MLECHSYTYACTHSQASWDRGTCGELAILTQTDVPIETRYCVYVMAHNCTPSQIFMHLHFAAQTDSLIGTWWHTSRKESFPSLTSVSSSLWMESCAQARAHFVFKNHTLPRRLPNALLTLTQTHSWAHTKTCIAGPLLRCFLLFASWDSVRYCTALHSAHMPSSITLMAVWGLSNFTWYC